MDFHRVGAQLRKVGGFRIPAGLGARAAKTHDFAPGLQTAIGGISGAIPGYYAGEAIDKDSGMSKGIMTALGAILGGQVGNPLFRRKMVGIGHPDVKRNAPWYDPKRKEILQSHLIKNLLGPKVAAGGLIFGGKLVNDWSSLTGSLRNAAANVDATSASVRDTVKGSAEDVKATARNVAEASGEAKKRIGAVGGHLEGTSRSIADAAEEIKRARLGSTAGGALSAVEGIKSSVDRGASAITGAADRLSDVADRGLDTVDRAGARIDSGWDAVGRAAPWVGGGAATLGLGALLMNAHNRPKKKRRGANDSEE